MKIALVVFGVGWAFLTLGAFVRMVQSRHSRKGADGKPAPIHAIAVIAAGVGLMWPVFASVVIVKRFMPKKAGPEFAPFGEVEMAEKMRRAVAQRAAERVRAMHAEKKSS